MTLNGSHYERGRALTISELEPNHSCLRERESLRIGPIFMHFNEEKKLAVSVSLFHFKPGSQERVD